MPTAHKSVLAIELTPQQLEKLVDVLVCTTDEGPAGEGWKSDELKELCAIVERVQKSMAGDPLSGIFTGTRPSGTELPEMTKMATIRSPNVRRKGYR